ncbi:MAG: ABC transporter ATP-binding protein/permease [Clostridiales bacterium]|nr:ABC transporter ATP-binding protein/permease [Clostridiales bacterium]
MSQTEVKTNQGSTKKKKDDAGVRLPWFGIKRILPFLKRYRRQIILMALFGVVGSAVDIVIPLFQSYAINNYIVTGVLDTLPYFIGLYLLTLTVQISANCFTTYTASCVEYRVGHDLKQASFDHLQTLSFSYFNQNSVGYVHARIMSDTARIGELVSWSFMDAIWNISYIAGAVFVMLKINWKLALAVIAVVPIAALLIAFSLNKLTALNRAIREMNSRISGDYNEGIAGAKTIKTLVVEDKMVSEFEADTGKMKKTSVHASRFRGLLFSSVSFFSYVALALVLWRGGIITMKQAMGIGTLSAFMSYAQGLMDPLLWIIDAFSSLINTQVNIERVTRLIDTASDVTDTPAVIEKYGDTFSPKRENWEPLNGDIEFDDVTFKYPDGDETVLEHFSLRVPCGTRVAIVGETGAGKSTLVNLVCRFYEPTDGRVLIDGRDARERSQLWLHSNIGYVLQSPHLFSGSVRENLRYGKPDATDEEINAALATVSADAVVARMDKGLDSEVGEGGDLLSTGEKQLLSFARAIIADPRILVLDEATSSVDTITEQIIQNAIGKVTAGRTSFIIAHRLSTVRDADVIIVVRDGKIVEQGRHGELMRKKGYYYSLYTRQYEKEAVEGIL